MPKQKCRMCMNDAEVFVTRDSLDSINIISGRTVLGGDLICKKCAIYRYTMGGSETYMVITSIGNMTL